MEGVFGVGIFIDAFLLTDVLSVENAEEVQIKWVDCLRTFVVLLQQIDIPDTINV